MQRIQLTVAREISHYFSCEVPEKSIEKVLAKMTDRYHLDLSKYQKYRRKKEDQSVFDCVVWFSPVSEKYVLYVLVSAGGDIADYNKKGFDVLCEVSQHIQFDGKYELVKTTRKKSAIHQNHGRSNDHSETWTWRMSRSYYQDFAAWLERTVMVYPEDPSQFKKMVYNLEHLPGFRGVRKQIGFLWAHTVKNWKHHTSVEMPVKTLKLGFYRALGHDCSSLAELRVIPTPDAVKI
jgi:hypothetical protein